MTRVRLMLELDSEFVTRLRHQLTIDGIGKDEPTNSMLQTPLGILGTVVLGEAMGAHPEQTYLKIPNAWRNNIDIVPSERRTKKDGTDKWVMTNP